ncbi:MAG: DNA gyrase inhibitor YacG [Desulfobacteraceae bacterium]|nr:DNA gyrase inhibitor YacG [Desulfobacteraceae bacterium]
MTATGTKKQHKCPACGRPAPYGGNPFRPFCSKRCKMIDLSAWLKEDYCISGEWRETGEPVERKEKRGE